MNKKENPTDRFLILQYKEGNTSVLAELVRRYHKVFCEKAYWVTKDKEIAKDAAQDSWITIINNLNTLKNVNSFKSWALRIVYTRAIDSIKHRNKESDKLKSIAIPESDRPSPKDQSHVIQNKLLKAIKTLPKEKQDIIRLFYVEEYSLKEISSFLKIPVGTVKSRLFKSREKLKSIIKL